MWLWGPSDVAVAQVCVAHTLNGATIQPSLCIAGCICAMLFHCITSCNTEGNNITDDYKNTIACKLGYMRYRVNNELYISAITLLLHLVAPYQECRLLALHWWSHNSPHSTVYSCRAAPTDSHCQHVHICYSWESLGMHSIACVERSDWRNRWRWILCVETGRKTAAVVRI